MSLNFFGRASSILKMGDPFTLIKEGNDVFYKVAGVASAAGYTLSTLPDGYVISEFVKGDMDFQGLAAAGFDTLFLFGITSYGNYKNRRK